MDSTCFLNNAAFGSARTVISGVSPQDTFGNTVKLTENTRMSILMSRRDRPQLAGQFHGFILQTPSQTNGKGHHLFAEIQFAPFDKHPFPALASSFNIDTPTFDNRTLIVPFSLG